MRLLLAVLLTAAASAQTVEYLYHNEGVLEEKLRLAHPRNPERFRRLKGLFEASGCAGDALREQRVKGSKEPNLICAVAAAGEGARRIVVGAHFDCNGGDGVIDNWSGAVLLPGIAEFLRSRPRRHTFELVGFAAEEKGLLGSRAYLKAIAKDDRKNIAAAITLDSLGLTSTKCWPHGSTPELVTAAANVARALNLPFGGVNVERVGTTDSAVFLGARIPVLSLHSVTQETWRTINGPKDVWKAVSWKDYYDTHRFVSALVTYLDQTLP